MKHRRRRLGEQQQPPPPPPASAATGGRRVRRRPPSPPPPSFYGATGGGGRSVQLYGSRVEEYVSGSTPSLARPCHHVVGLRPIANATTNRATSLSSDAVPARPPPLVTTTAATAARGVVVVADMGSGLLAVVKPSYHHSLDRTRGASSTTSTSASPPGRTTNDGPRAPAAAALFPLRRSRSEGEDQPLDAPPLQLPPPPPAATAVGGAESGEEEEEEAAAAAYLQPRRSAPRQKQQQPTEWRRGRERGRPGAGGDEALLQIRAPLLRAAATERSGSGAAAGKQVESERWATAVAYAREEARREIGAPAAARRELVAGRMRERCRQQRVERRAEERAATTRRAREGHLRHVVLLAPLLALALVLRHVLHLL